ncbi:MAG: crossover junction endodeoxyribonuclease RuvC [Candidatus Levybacteria bacterium]|nr:crossover junction endodeoxyribonuclease RuvC [Candidatus Levybacteria bacterium]
MIILGVDPGIGRCGWGIIETRNSKLEIRNSGCIETRANSPIEERLLIISSQIEKFIKEYKPDVLSIEELFFSTNAKTAFTVGQARGVVLLLAGQNKLDVAIYTPLQVKMALTGYGRADKNQIGQMVKVILKLEKIPKIDDTSDALAVAITHAFSSKLGKLISNN